MGRCGSAVIEMRHEATQIMNAALVSRGLEPLTFTCPCCNDEFERDERAKADEWQDDLVKAVIELWGVLPCEGCMDECVQCDCCGKATSHIFNPHQYEEDGYVFCDGECHAKWEYECKVEEDHIRFERAALR